MRSSLDINSLFKILFENIVSASKFQTSQSRWVNFGFQPYFKKLLPRDLIVSSYFSKSFDEPINIELKEKMDVHIWFWNEKENAVSISCFDFRSQVQM